MMSWLIMEMLSFHDAMVPLPSAVISGTDISKVAMASAEPLPVMFWRERLWL